MEEAGLGIARETVDDGVGVLLMVAVEGAAGDGTVGEFGVDVLVEDGGWVLGGGL